MYNEEQKRRFITDKESDTILDDGFLERLFRKTERMETEFDKDLCEFTTAEILELYRIMNLRSIDSIVNINSQLSSYGSWCMQQNLIPDGINHFNELNTDILNTCVNKTALKDSILDEKTFHGVVSGLINPRDQFVLQMLYETGKSKGQENIFKARLEDIDIESRKMKLFDGRVVDVSNRLIGITENAVKEEYYNIYDPSPDAKVCRRYLVDTGFIYKETTSVTNTEVIGQMARLNRSLVVALRYLGYKKTWTKLNTFAESGIINMIKHLMEENDMTAEQVLKNVELREKINNQHNAKIRSVTTFMRKYGELF